MPHIIIITGPTGSGKTTICKLLSEKTGFSIISGDEIRQTLFPEKHIITDFPEQLQQIKQTILKKAKEHFSSKESVIIDYVILGKEYIQSFQKSFDKHLIFKVLLPEKEIIYQRDIERECWTSGKKTIDELYRKYEELVELIGKENYIDNGNEPAETTANKLLALLI